MNLHGLVRAQITVVNPDITCTYQQSAGYLTDAAGNRKPLYVLTTGVSIQVQAVSAKDLQHIDFLNIQGELRSVYLYGNSQGVVRPNNMGGDLLWFAQVPGATTQCWKVVNVAETWPDWSRVIVCLQSDSLSGDALSQSMASGDLSS